MAGRPTESRFTHPLDSIRKTAEASADLWIFLKAHKPGIAKLRQDVFSYIHQQGVVLVIGWNQFRPYSAAELANALDALGLRCQAKGNMSQYSGALKTLLRLCGQAKEHRRKVYVTWKFTRWMRVGGKKPKQEKNA